MTIGQAIFLGLMQGLTEFLPVSSSGHLVFLQDLLGVRSPGITFEVLVHLGTLMAVLVAFAGDVSRMVVEGLASGAEIVRGTSPRATWRHYPHGRLAWMVIVGSLPTAVIGLILGPWLAGLFESTVVVGFMLLVTGVFLAATARVPARQERTSPGIGTAGGAGGGTAPAVVPALLIGVVQGLAIIPGVSRSGSTIAAGLFLGLGREMAARFSFLLSIPAVLGATLIDLVEVARGGSAGISTAALAVGTLSAAVSGYVAIRLLMGVVKKGRLWFFAYYVWALGGLIILWKLF